jgi:NADH-quinone oxidoreductase subunit D
VDENLNSGSIPYVSEASVSVEIETEDMTLNIGPQHPSTHGVLRLVAKVDGEKISSVEPVLGYMHRGYEKLAEVRTYPQITTLVNRIDWVSGFANEIPFIAATEKLMEIEAPERAKHIRLILTEMARIASHFVFNGAYALEIGALTPIFLAMEDRERILDLIESVTGGRFHPNFNRIGGIKPAAGSGPTTKKNIQDLPAGFYQDTRDAMEKVLEAVERMENLVGGNEVFKIRTKGVGIISKELAEEYGVSGPILRASGVKFDYDIPIGENGDCYDRWYVRLMEMKESAKIILQAIDSMPSGPLQTEVPKVIKVPKGQSYVRTENPKGEMGYYVISEGGLGPYRLKVRTPSFSNISILPVLLEGQLLPDLIAIMGSLDFVLGDVDR